MQTYLADIIHSLFYNKGRIIKVTLTVVALFIIFLYSTILDKKEITFEKYMEEPKRYKNREFSLYEGKITHVCKGVFFYDYNGNVLKIAGNIDTEVGEYIDIIIKVKDNNLYQLAKYHTSYKFSPLYKSIISLIALCIVTSNFFLKYKINFSKKGILERR